MRRVYFDNSAINDLHEDDPSILDALASGQIGFQPIISELNIIELGSHPDHRERACRLRTLSRLIGDHIPIPAAGDLLSGHLEAYEGPFDDAELRRRGAVLRALLQNPENDWTAEAQSLADVYRRQQKEWYAPTWRAVREHYRIEFRGLPELEEERSLRSVAHLLRRVASDPEFLRSLVGDLFDRSQRAREDPAAFLEAVPEWEAFLAGFACVAHRRVFREKRFGDKYNPGTLDLYQLAYLPYCELFVTSDKSLRIVARMPSAVLDNCPEPISYPRFRLLLRERL